MRFLLFKFRKTGQENKYFIANKRPEKNISIKKNCINVSFLSW